MATRHAELHAALGKLIDAAVQACLTPDAHVENLLANLFQFGSYRASWHMGRFDQPLANSEENASRFLAHVEGAISRVQVHVRHGSRCCTGSNGDCKCSQAFPREVCQCTAPHTIDIGYCGHSLDPRSSLSTQLDETVVIEPKRPRIDAAAHLDAVRKLVDSVEKAMPACDDAAGVCMPRTMIARQMCHRVSYYFFLMCTCAIHADVDMSAATAEITPDVGDALERLCSVTSGQAPISAERRAEVRAALEECKRAAGRGERMNPAHLVTLIDMLPPYYKSTLLLVLAQRNSRVVEYSPVTTAVFGSNTAVYFLSSGAAARIAVFYLLGA